MRFKIPAVCEASMADGGEKIPSGNDVKDEL